MSRELEENVRRLLRRSYVPALPAPPFRDRMEALFLAEVARRARREATPRVTAWRPRRLAVAVAALAAAVLALLAGWRFLAEPSPETRERLLARGAVALGHPDGIWRAADAEERAHGIRVPPPALVAATPEDAELDLLVTAGRIHLDSRSEILVEVDGAELRATLRSGTAAFHSHDERTELERGVRQDLRAAARPSEGLVGASREAVDAGPDVHGAGAEHASEPALPAPANRLAGRVTSAATGAPLPEFTVALLAERLGNETPPPLVREFADADGRFVWPDPPRGKQRVFVHAEGHALLLAGELDLGVPQPELALALEVGSPLRGLVLDGDGNPIAGALVISEHDVPTDGLFLHDAERAFWLPVRAKSGPDGSFELAHLKPGVHTVRASAPGLAPAWVENVRIPSSPLDELVLTLSGGGTVEGTVTRADGGPWSGAQLVVLAMDQVQHPRTNFALAQTDTDGRYRFEHLPATTMVVVLLRSDDRPDVRPLQVIDGETVRADFATPRGGARIAGRLLDAEGAAVAPQNIGLFQRDSARWDEDWVASATSETGEFVFEGVEPGEYLFYLIDTMGRGLRCIGELAVPPSVAEIEHELVLPTGVLVLRIVEAEGEAPVADAAVVLTREEPDGGQTFFGFGATDATGTFALRELGPGTYTAWAYPTKADLGFARSEPVVLGPDAAEHAEVTIALGPGGGVDVVVRDAEGTPLEGAIVVFFDEEDEEHTFSRLPYTDARGRFRAQGLRPGTYRVGAHLDGYQGTPVSLRFDLGDEREVPVVLAPLSPR